MSFDLLADASISLAIEGLSSNPERRLDRDLPHPGAPAEEPAP